MWLPQFLNPDRWIDRDRLVTDALMAAQLVTQRWDVPTRLKNGEPVPADLRDTDPRWCGTADGHGIAGRLLPYASTYGSASAAMPLLFAAFAIMGMAWMPIHLLPLLLSIPLGGLDLFAAAWLLWAICAATRAMPTLDKGRVVTASGAWGVWSIALAGVPLLTATLPLFLIAWSYVTTLAEKAFGSVAGFVGAGVLGIVGLVVAWRALSSQLVRARLKGLALVLATMTAGGLITGLCLSFFGGAMGGWLGILAALFWSGLTAAILPVLYAEQVWKQRALILAEQAIRFSGESAMPPGATDLDERTAQAERAAADPTPVFKLGTSIGVFTKTLDPFSPDPGLAFCTSAGDLSQHLAIVGVSGAGKTYAMRKQLLEWIQSGQGGAWIADGKGSLVGEFANIVPGFIDIKPGKVELALFEGLTPAEIVDVFEQMNRAGAENAAGKFFSASARTMFFNSLVFLSALTIADGMKNGKDGRTWRHTSHDMTALLARAQRASKLAVEVMENALALVREQLGPEISAGGILSDAVEYMDTGIQGIEARTRSDIHSTLKTWFGPLLENPELLPWAHCETGIDVTAVLRGGFGGVNTPTFLYGIAGKVCQGLVKSRLISEIRKRGLNPEWSKAQKQVNFFVDEAPDLIERADAEIAPMARGLGMVMTYAAQDVEQYEVALGSAVAGRTFMGHFSSAMVFKAERATAEWMQKRLGEVIKLKKKAVGPVLDYANTAKAIADSPLRNAVHASADVYRGQLRDGAGTLAMGHDSDHTDEQPLRAPVRTGNFDSPEPLLTLADFHRMTSKKGVAVVEVMRGGTRRRDFIKVDGLDGREMREKHVASKV